MSKAIIIIEDNEEGSVTVSADFGPEVDENSQAHGMAMVLVESVLRNAKHYNTIEDTAPEHNIEPSRIIAPEGVQ